MADTFSWEEAQAPAPPAAPASKRTFSYEEATAPAKIGGNVGVASAKGGPPAADPNPISYFMADTAKRAKEAEDQYSAVGKREKAEPKNAGEAVVAGLQRAPVFAGVSLNDAQRLLSTLGLMGSPVGGAGATVAGRPVETLTKGKVSADTAGDVASMALPFVGETMDALNLARTGARMGFAPRVLDQIAGEEERASGLSPKTAKTIVQRTAPKAVPPPSNTELSSNVGALKRLNIPPSLAVASPSRGLRGLTNTLGGNFLVGGPIRHAVGRAAKGFGEGLDAAVDARGGPVSAAEAGSQIKKGVERFARPSAVVRQVMGGMDPDTAIATGQAAKKIPSRKLGFGNKAENLWARADAMIGQSGQPIAVPNFSAALQDAQLRFHSPALTKLFRNPVLQRLTALVEKNGGNLSWNDARELRTTIREALKSDDQLRKNVPDATVDQVYSALTKDLQAGAGKLGGPKAENAYKQANQFYRTGMDRINNTLSRFYGPKADPASVFNDLVASAKSGARENLGKLKQVKQSVSPEEWQAFTASVLEEMGTALPGKATGETGFSFDTFMTNFNKLNQRGGKDSKSADTGLKVLFGGAHGPESEQMVNDLAHVATQMRELHKLYNYSQTGNRAGDMATLGMTGGLALSHHPLAAVAGVLMGNGASKLLESPAFVHWLAGIPATGDPAVTAQALRRLAAYAGQVGAVSDTFKLPDPPAQSQAAAQ